MVGEGDGPQTEERVYVDRIRNLCDEDRCGAMYLQSSDKDAPYKDVIDGIAKNMS